MRQYIARLLEAWSEKLAGTEALFPELGPEDRALLHAADSLTMTPRQARWAFIQAIRHAEAQAIAGDIVECGVWRGGNLIIAGLLRKELAFERQIWGFDTYAGMTPPTDTDFKPAERLDVARKHSSLDRGTHNDWCYTSQRDVLANFEARTGSADVKLVRGPVEQTLKQRENLPTQISVLRLDTDFYESTRSELEILYPLLSPGGVLIIDDYGEWAGARRAVDEYFAGRHIWLHYVTSSVRLMVKQ